MLPVFRHSVYETNHAWKDLYSELFDKPGNVFDKDTDEASVVILDCKFLQKGIGEGML
jgi:hypothetical protein